MKTLLILLLGLTLTACGGSGGGSGTTDDSNPADPDDSITEPIYADYAIKSGDGFSCIHVSTGLYCWGASAPVRTINADIQSYSLWNDTVCFEAIVAQRPAARTPGTATYCFGEANLNPSYANNGNFGGTIIYGGPTYSPAANGSSDLTYVSDNSSSMDPFVGADMTLDFWMNQTVTLSPFMVDGTNLTSEHTETCEVTEDLIKCPSVEVSLE